MAVKPNAQFVRIKEQIIEDKASGLTLMFSLHPSSYSPIRYRLRICGDALPLGNRDLLFTEDGELGATGTATGGICETSWLQEIVSEEEQERRKAERETRVERKCAEIRARIRAEENPNFEWDVETEEIENDG